MKTSMMTMVYMSGMLVSFASEVRNANPVEEMSASLKRGGVEGLMVTVREERWTAPCIPSKWFVDNRIGDTEKKRMAQAAREFGRQIAVELEKLAQEQQTLPVGETLYKRTCLLCDTGEWCAETVGYGNIFLARRFLDLAAVGLARLTASTNVPLADCEILAARMTPPWLGMAYRQQILNGEAGTNLFINVEMTNEELDWQWAIGWTMQAMKEKRTQIKKVDPPNPDFVDVNAFTNNLGFFTAYELPEAPVTHLRSWDFRQHRLIAMGLELQSVKKVLGLLAFRNVVGYYPEAFVRSEEERLQLEKDIREAAKWGAKITPMENSPSFDPLKEAFRRAWLNRHSNIEKDDYNKYVIAFQAYCEVNNGVFFDQDTEEIYKMKQLEEMSKARQRKNE
jgi:hypothetical protein